MSPTKNPRTNSSKAIARIFPFRPWHQSPDSPRLIASIEPRESLVPAGFVVRRRRFPSRGIPGFCEYSRILWPPSLDVYTVLGHSDLFPFALREPASPVACRPLPDRGDGTRPASPLFHPERI